MLVLGFDIEPERNVSVRKKQRKACGLYKKNLYYLQISAKQGCLDTGSSSNGGGAWPYTISQLISSKSGQQKQNRKMIEAVPTYEPKDRLFKLIGHNAFSSEKICCLHIDRKSLDMRGYSESWWGVAQIHWWRNPEWGSCTCLRTSLHNRYSPST